MSRWQRERHAITLYNELEQSLIHSKSDDLAANDPDGDTTHTLTPLNRVWLGVAIDFLLENQWLIRTDEPEQLLQDLLSASVAILKP